MKKLILLTLIIFFDISATAREVAFSWEPMEGASQYEIQLSTTKAFTSLVLTQKLKTPTFSASLGAGKYFYRVRVIDNANHPGKWTDTAEVKVSTPPPELMTPQDGFKATYFDKPTEIKFSWKPIDLTSVYEIIVRDAGGVEVAHITQDKTEYKYSFQKGEYQWQVRSIGKSPIPGQNGPEEVPSEFSKARSFKIDKSEMTKPILKTPLDGARLVSHTPVDFSWSQDPRTHLADLTVEKTDGQKSDSKKFENIKGESISKKFETPGTYQWSILAKEDSSAPGITSETRNFTILEDSLFAGNYELELSAAYVTDVYQTNSSLQNRSIAQINQVSNSSGMRYGLSAGYYVFRSLGFFVSMREAPLAVENTTSMQNELDGTLRLRYGANGFFQEFWFGYRAMDIIEPENNPTIQVVDFKTTGPLVGSRISAEVNSRIKIQCSAYYYKPLTTNQSSLGPFNADVAGGSLGVKWNIKNRFWIGYRFAIERMNGQLGGILSPPYVNSSWGQFRSEPLYLSLSYEK